MKTCGVLRSDVIFDRRRVRMEGPTAREPFRDGTGIDIGIGIEDCTPRMSESEPTIALYDIKEVQEDPGSGCYATLYATLSEGGKLVKRVSCERLSVSSSSGRVVPFLFLLRSETCTCTCTFPLPSRFTDPSVNDSGASTWRATGRSRARCNLL